jgi:metal iron transporter
MAGIGAAVLQVLSLRLGIATSMSLPAQIRALFLRIREHPRVKPYRWRRRATMAGLYALYGLAELAIIATDLAELLGSAIALNLWVARMAEARLELIRLFPQDLPTTALICGR